MLGPEVATYQRNSIVLIVAGLFTVGAIALTAALWMDPEGREAAYYCVALVALCAFWFAWVNSCKLTVHSDGISTESILGRKEMTFDDLDKFYYSAIKQSINFIPVGTYYSFKFVDANGTKIKFGNRYSGMAAIGGQLITLTGNTLLPKLARRFDAGETLDFGQIKLSRAEGISIKKTFKWKHISWDNLASHRIEKGTFYIFEAGQKFDTGTSLALIPNAFVLAALLDALREPRAAAASSTS